MTILVIDDSTTSLKLVCKFLAQMGHETLCAEDAEHGLELARKERPHLVLMDIVMPGMDGLEATRILKKDPATRHIKVVAHTAMAMKGDKERIIEAGCDGYISKPLDLKVFAATIEAFCASGS